VTDARAYSSTDYLSVKFEYTTYFSINLVPSTALVQADLRLVF